ncbi:MAG: tetratricopeptide repeat protein [Thermodesulfobacteriota bacterium]|nr:tetratricopeptide repeat protein [Thermodesulfobacteriota bacterium]
MSQEKKPGGLSRRDLLFGAVRKLRKDEEETAPEPAPHPAFDLGNAAYKNSDYEEAAARYRQCLENVPDHVEALKRLGYCLYRLGQYVKAEAEFRRVLGLREKDNFASLYLGLAYARMCEPDKAAAAWKGYFNPDEVRIQREINIQTALLETPEPPSAHDMAEAVEQAVTDRKRELAREG